MNSYNITVTGDRYPTSYVVEASDWSTAVARAIRLWKKRFRGSRTETLSVRAVKQVACKPSPNVANQQLN